MMKRLTKKEEEIMNLFWKHGGLFVKELRAFCPEPRPHINTLSTQVRLLEMEGFLGHNEFGSSYQYFPAVTRETYRRETLDNVVERYFDKSYLRAVSSLVRDEKISLSELKSIIAEIESGN